MPSPIWLRERAAILAEAAQTMDQKIAAVRLGQRVVDVPLVLGARGTPLAVGEKRPVRLSLNGPATIMSWSMAGLVSSVSQAGSCTIDVQVGTTVADAGSITSGTPMQLTAQFELTEQVPVGWALTIPDPSWLLVQALAADGILEEVAVTLRLAIGVDSNEVVVTDASGAAVTDSSGNLVTAG